MNNNNSKLCPYCSEDIKVGAIKCKHCHSMLDEDIRLKQSGARSENNKARNAKWRLPAIIISIMVVVAALSIIILNIATSELSRSDVIMTNFDTTHIGATNHHSFGYVTQQGDWIYYSHFGEGSNIYRMRSDGSERTLISNDDSLYLNVVGDWIYYLRRGDAIYRIRINGSERTQINDEVIGGFVVEGGWIYYSKSDNTADTHEVGIYKMSIDGSETVKINDDNTYKISLVDGWIYYANKNSDSNIYRVRVDGSDRTRINNDSSYNVNVVGDWIYFTTDSNLCKIRIDGTDRIIISEEKEHLSLMTSDLNVAGEWLYYTLYVTDREDTAFYLYKIRNDGKNRQQLNSDYTMLHNIAGGWVFYVNFDDDGKLYKIRVDGTDRQVVK